jgi:anti-sigma factor RsiW
MSASPCPDPEHLSSFVLGKLPETEALRVAAHSSECARCQRALRGLDSTADPLIDLLRRPADESPTPDLADLLRQAEVAGSRWFTTALESDNDSSADAPLSDIDFRTLLAPRRGPDKLGRMGE